MIEYIKKLQRAKRMVKTDKTAEIERAIYMLIGLLIGMAIAILSFP